MRNLQSPAEPPQKRQLGSAVAEPGTNIFDDGDLDKVITRMMIIDHIEPHRRNRCSQIDVEVADHRQAAHAERQSDWVVGE